MNAFVRGKMTESVWFIVPVFAFALGLSGQMPAAAPATKAPAQVEPWKKIPIPPLHDFKPVQPRRIELANGMLIFLEEDHELPFIDGTILIRGGSRVVSAAKV